MGKFLNVKDDLPEVMNETLIEDKPVQTIEISIREYQQFIKDRFKAQVYEALLLHDKYLSEGEKVIIENLSGKEID